MRMTGAGRERALLFDEKREMFRAGAVIVNLGLRNLTCTSFCVTVAVAASWTGSLGLSV